MTHDIGLDGFDPDDDASEADKDLTFVLNRENDLKSSIRYASDPHHNTNTSNVYSSSSLDLIANLRNSVKSRYLKGDPGAGPSGDGSPVETVQIGRALRIEDVARIGTDCVRVSLERRGRSGKNAVGMVGGTAAVPPAVGLWKAERAAELLRAQVGIILRLELD